VIIIVVLLLIGLLGAVGEWPSQYGRAWSLVAWLTLLCLFLLVHGPRF